MLPIQASVTYLSFKWMLTHIQPSLEWSIKPIEAWCVSNLLEAVFGELIDPLDGTTDFHVISCQALWVSVCTRLHHRLVRVCFENLLPHSKITSDDD